MKAVIYEEFGPPKVLQLKEVEKPVPKDNEILIKIHAATVSAEDPKLRKCDFPVFLLPLVGLIIGFNKPKKKILGMEFAGEIELTGDKVQLFKKGDKIYGYTGVGLGAHAEYRCMSESKEGIIALKPDNFNYKEAASVPNGALTALVFLKKKGKIKKGEKVLVYGASGSVGTAAVQLAKYFGADVTGVCSTSNIEMVKSLGAGKVIDYTKEDFTKYDETYDIIFDTVGKTKYSQCKKLLNNNGRYLLTDFGLYEMLLSFWTKIFSSRKVVCAASNFYWKSEDLDLLRKIIEEGKYKSIIDKIYPINQIVEAHKYVEMGHKKGNVVVLLNTEK